MKTVRIDRIKLVAEIARTDRKMYEIAEAAGITRATLTSIKGGKSCAADTAEKLAAGLGVPLAALLPDQGRAAHG